MLNARQHYGLQTQAEQVFPAQRSGRSAVILKNP